MHFTTPRYNFHDALPRYIWNVSRRIFTRHFSTRFQWSSWCCFTTLLFVSWHYIMIHYSRHILTTFLVYSRRFLTKQFPRHIPTTLLSSSRHYFTLHFQDAFSRRFKYQKRCDSVSWGSVVKTRLNPQDAFSFCQDTLSRRCFTITCRETASW